MNTKDLPNHVLALALKPAGAHQEGIMGLIFFGLILVAVLATIVIKSDIRNPRMAGNRLMNKGLLVFAVGWLVIVIGSSGASDILEVFHRIGIVVSIIGFAIAAIGWIKHVIMVLKPLNSAEIKLMIDPGFDIPYTKCPHCQKIEVRVFGKKAKCPNCGGVIKPSEKFDT